MTKEAAINKLKEEYEYVVSALSELPEGADIINAALDIGRCAETYIQLFQEGTLPDGLPEPKRYEDGAIEYSVKVHGVQVIWLADREDSYAPD